MASSQIRKRSLKAATWIYVGFLVGALNTYFLTHKSWFLPDEYGLTRSLLDISILISAFSTLGVTSYLFKFFPYYKANLEARQNDMLSVALVISLSGLAVSSISLWLLQPLIEQKFGTNAPLLVSYFYYVVPLAGFVLLYSVLEAYAYGFDKGVFTSFLREVLLRVYMLVVIILKVFGLINFSTFILLFALQYACIVIALCIHLHLQKQLWLTFKISKVTIKYRKKIFAILSLTFIVIIAGVLRQSIDGLVLAARQDLAKVGIFGFSAYLVSVLQAPFRSMIAITIPILSRSWKEKNIKEIKRIYQRSSINLLTFALFVFFCIWINFTGAIQLFGINPEYLQGKWIFFILGIVTIIEMGTGVNGQIIGTSTYWRFELWTSLLLTCLIIPLSYFLTVRYGIYGPAFANLISFSIYNAVRVWFLWKKFNMQPFNKKTLEVLSISGGTYFLVYLLFNEPQGLLQMFGATALFAAAYVSLVYWLNISPDVKPVVKSVLLKFNKRNP